MTRLSRIAAPAVFAFCLALPANAQFLAGDNLPSLEHLELEEAHIKNKEEHGESHASGMRPELGPVTLGNPTQAVRIVRVGLSYSFTATGAFSEFLTRHHPFAEISHTAGSVHVIDVATGKQVVALDAPGPVVRANRDANGYHVSVDGVELGVFDGPLFFRPTDGANTFNVVSIRRSFSGIKVPNYRGAIELTHGAGTEVNRLHVVNVVEVEDYVPGVVANESIASFHMEALKAQAVAARGYAIAIRSRFGPNFPYDVVDSSASQVYRGVISEHPRAVQASNETIGLVTSYQGTIIGALYSSSMGGHTEHNEWIFNVPSNQVPGTNVTPYLRAIHDGDGVAPDFSTPSGVSAFWKANPLPTIYDDCGRVGNRFSRWRVVLTGAQIRARLNPLPPAGVNVTNVEITKVAPSGRAAIARISLSNGTFRDILGWDPLRNFFRPAVTTPALCGTTTIPAGMVLNNPSVIDVAKNADGTVNNATVWGGGWGHNVGMSQYGAQGRARAGQIFSQILKAYYTNVDIGTYPIDIGRDRETSGPPVLRQQFVAPTANATLYVRNASIRKLRVHVNELYDIALNEDDFVNGSASVDLSGLLISGVNTIQYNPVGQGEATVTVVVE